MALMVGNSVMFKMSNNAIFVGQMVEDVVNAGELPEGLFHHVVGSGSAILQGWLDNGINRVCFTGSVPVGISVAQKCATKLVPFTLELGGNDAMIVLDDADLDRATAGALWGGFLNTGQTCCGVERIFVHKSIYDKFLKMIKEKCSKLRHGDPIKNRNKVDLGCFCTTDQLEIVRKHFKGNNKIFIDKKKDAIEKGAKVEAQSKPVGDVSKGNFFPATLITNVNDDMLVMKEETFGPILPIVPFESVEEAIKLANKDKLALTASIWTNNNKRGRELARKLDGGVITINDQWGGEKLSGFARTHGEDGLKHLCNMKIIQHDIMPGFINKKNSFWYPYTEISYNLIDDICKSIGFGNPLYIVKNLPSIVDLMMSKEAKRNLKWGLWGAGSLIVGAGATLFGYYYYYK